MPKSPEFLARQTIDAALVAAGWLVQDVAQVNLSAGRGVAVREFPLKTGHGFADYLLFVNGKATGVVEAKPEGTTLTGVEIQTQKYSVGVPNTIPAAMRPLPFLYESTGVETRFTNELDPAPRSRPVFSFHRPETLADWLTAEPLWLPVVDGQPDPRSQRPSTLRSRLASLPSVDEAGLWPAQLRAIQNLDLSLRHDRPRALIQMATGSGKTFTAVTAAYRLVKFGGARRVLFLVDRSNLGRQALKEFQQYEVPGDGRKFTELYNVQRLTSNRIDPVARVVITTIQRLYSMLKGEHDLDPTLEEGSGFDTAAGLVREPVPVAYNPAIPIEFFDILFIDECHRSIYSLWRQVLEYFDAHLIGLTATPSKQTFGFFRQNLVMEYNHAQAVADGVNVDFDVYKIQTRISEQGSTVEAGPSEIIGKRDRETRAVRWERLDEDFTYDADALDRQVVARDQLRTVVQAFRAHLFTDIFPGRREVPKTLIYAKDDSHADDIVQIVREEFGRGNDFCQKITYRTGTVRVVGKTTGADGKEVETVTYKSSGIQPEDLLASFRNSYDPRIVVTVDMIATGTDIKPIEIVMFMRAVRSRIFFEQMKGRGVRVINPTDLKSVTPDADGKDHFVIVDCVGICEQEMSDSQPLERQPIVSFDKLLQAVAFGSIDPAVLSSLAGRLARMERRLGPEDLRSIVQVSGGKTLKAMAGALVEALDPDMQVAEARRTAGLPDTVDPPADVLEAARTRLLTDAVAPIATKPELRARLIEIRTRLEQTIDETSKDEVIFAGHSEEATARAKSLVKSFEQFIADNKDQITALQVLYSRPYRQRLRFADIKALAEAIQAPPRSWTPEKLWSAYATLARDKVRGVGAQRLVTDVVSLVRFALSQDDELRPFNEAVETRYQQWLDQQANRGRAFTPEQRQWLDLIVEHVAASLAIEIDDFDYTPFAQRGGAARAFQVFGDQLKPLLDELNEVLAA